MGSEDEAEATSAVPPTVRIELGGLAISIENAPDLDTAARVALGLLAKIEPLARHIPIGFVGAHGGQAEIRPQPDLSWDGEEWDVQ